MLKEKFKNSEASTADYRMIGAGEAETSLKTRENQKILRVWGNNLNLINMKIFFVMLVVLSMCCFTNVYASKPKPFCFENMCFNAKGWKNIQTGIDEKTSSSFITTAKPVSGGYGGIAVLLIQKSKVPEGMNLNDYADKRFQETIANYNTSNNTGGTKMKVVSQDGLVPFVVNTYAGKSFGVKLKQGIANVYQRIIILEKDGYFYEIQTTSNMLNTKSHTKLFVKILNTLTL